MINGCYTNTHKMQGLSSVPCISLHKLHYVGTALEALYERVLLPGETTAQSIVKGHREKTLGLLWTVTFHFLVPCISFSYPLLISLYIQIFLTVYTTFCD